MKSPTSPAATHSIMLKFNTTEVFFLPSNTREKTSTKSKSENQSNLCCFPSNNLLFKIKAVNSTSNLKSLMTSQRFLPSNPN